MAPIDDDGRPGRRDEMFQPVDGSLQERAFAIEGAELLRDRRTEQPLRERREATAEAGGEDDRVESRRTGQ
jgi:hypothetical protein